MIAQVKLDVLRINAVQPTILSAGWKSIPAILLIVQVELNVGQLDV